MKNTIEILREGVYTSIQDLRRTGFKKYGVPKSGPMDEYSHILTNWLLDKKIISELLEITYYGPKIKINFDTKIALYGSKCEVKLNNNKIETGKTISIKSGDVLDIKKCINANRVYLGFSAKMKLKKTFNSKSTYDKIQIGGLNGKKLLKNDIIEFDQLKNCKSKKIPSSFMRFNNQNMIIRVIKGIHFDRVNNYDNEDEIKFKISPNSDRMGLRLIDYKIKLNDYSEIESTVVTKGSIQIPKDGNPIILMSDSQSTGGYPIFGNICKIDISKLSQVKPNQKIKFKFISLKESNKLIEYENEKFKSKLNLDLSS
ncbi:MAG: urea carboxylase [Flammeovirgaceae bacterium]|nr:MAG: urea carboxylase [Flammeovirgaceae bacterium]